MSVLDRAMRIAKDMRLGKGTVGPGTLAGMVLNEMQRAEDPAILASVVEVFEERAARIAFIEDIGERMIELRKDVATINVPGRS